jgi:hypothetical protein
MVLGVGITDCLYYMRLYKQCEFCLVVVGSCWAKGTTILKSCQGEGHTHIHADQGSNLELNCNVLYCSFGLFVCTLPVPVFTKLLSWNKVNVMQSYTLCNSIILTFAGLWMEPMLSCTVSQFSSYWCTVLPFWVFYSYQKLCSAVLHWFLHQARHVVWSSFPICNVLCPLCH